MFDCVMYLFYQFADSPEKENINSVLLKYLLNGSNQSKVFMHKHEVPYQHIQLVYQNAYGPDCKRSAAAPKEIYPNPIHFENLCLIL